MLRRGPGLQDTAPFQLPQNLLMSFLLSEWSTRKRLWRSSTVSSALSELSDGLEA